MEKLLNDILDRLDKEALETVTTKQCPDPTDNSYWRGYRHGMAYVIDEIDRAYRGKRND